MTRKHVIVDVRFQQTAEQGRPMTEAPILCSCGEVTTSGEWETHRGPTATMQRLERSHAAWKSRQVAA